MQSNRGFGSKPYIRAYFAPPEAQAGGAGAPLTVAIVIVNYRTPQMVCDCLDSLASETGDGLARQVFVGDALSGDGSLETISDHIAAKGYGGWASCTDLGANRGFAYGNNALIEAHVWPDPSFDYVHFLNPDTRIHPGAVRHLAAFLRAHPEAGVVGSALEKGDGTPDASGFRVPRPWREFFRGARLGLLERMVPNALAPIEPAALTETTEVDWVSGASFMVPRRVLEQIGLMDPGYFLYFEEVDLIRRIHAAGFSVWHLPESRVVHLAGQSTGLRPGQGRAEPLPAYWFHARWRFFTAHYGIFGAVLANILFLAGDLLYRITRVVFRKPITKPLKLRRNYLRFGFGWRHPDGTKPPPARS